MRIVLLCLLIVQLPLLPVQQAALGQQNMGGGASDDAWIEARQLYLAENFEDAREKIEDVISSEPNRYDTWQAWVATYRPGPHLEGAEQELQRRIQQDSDSPHLWFARAMVARYSGNFDDAREWFAAAAKLDPESEVIPLEHHKCFPEKDPQAKQLLEQALKVNSDNLSVLDEWTQFQLEQEKRPADEVEAELKLKYPSDKNAILADFALGVFSRHRKPNTDAHKQQAVKLLENVVQARPSAAIAWSKLATLYRQLKQFDKATQAIERGQSIAWWQTTWFEHLESLAFYRRQAQDQKGAEAALPQSRRLTRFFPDSKRAWSLLALDLAGVGQRDEAIDTYRKALKRDWWRQDEIARWNLAFNLSQAGRPSEALPLYLDVLDIDPDYLDQRDVPAKIIGDLGQLNADDLTSLDQWMENKIKELPNAVWPQLMRARITAARKHYDVADRQFAAIVESFPNSIPEAMTHWGNMRVQQEKYTLAIELFLDALRYEYSYKTAFDALNNLLNQDTLPGETGDDSIQQLRQLAKQHPTDREPLEYLAAALETLAYRRADHHLYEEALVPRLKLCSLNATDDEDRDAVQKADYEKVAKLYAALGEFDAAFLFYEKAGKEGYRDAGEFLRTASESSHPSPFRQQKRETENRPQVFSASNNVDFTKGNTVNLQNANYLFALIDSTSRRPSLLKVERSYNSRSLHRGLFGYGWTTVFETEIRFDETTDTLQVLTSSGYTADYELTSDYQTRLAEELLRRRKRDGQTVTEEFRKSLDDKSSLMNEAEAAGMFGPKSGRIRPLLQWTCLITPEDQYEKRDGSLHIEEELLVFDEAESQNTYRWNQAGQLTSISHPVLGEIVLEYTGDRVTRIIEPDSGDWIRLEYNDVGCVKHLVESGGRDAVYLYSSDGDCLASRGANGEVHGFLYDRLSNLTAIRYPDGRTQRMRYNMPRDWILWMQASDGNTEYEFAYEFYPGYETAFYGTEIRSFWMGKPISRSVATYGDMKRQKRNETEFVGSQRQFGDKIYRLSRNPLAKQFSNIMIDRKRSMLEWDESGRPIRILKPDGSVIQFSYDSPAADATELLVNRIRTRSGNYQFRFKNDRVTSVSGPHGFRAKIVRKGNLPDRIVSDEWTIELIRDESDHVVDYRLQFSGEWRSIGRKSIEQLRRALSAQSNAWKLGKPIDWAEESENTDLAFILARLHQLYDVWSRSRLSGHSLDCVSCFHDAIQNDLRGNDLELFEKQYLPKFR